MSPKIVPRLQTLSKLHAIGNGCCEVDCVQFRTFEANMRVPIVRERVVIEGRKAVFLVVWADIIRRVADLIPLCDHVDFEEDVPFGLIQPVDGEN